MRNLFQIRKGFKLIVKAQDAKGWIDVVHSRSKLRVIRRLVGVEDSSGFVSWKIEGCRLKTSFSL